MLSSNRKFVFRVSLLLGSLGPILILPNAYALDAKSSIVEETIIVTASKRDQRIVDVPTAVTAIAGKDLVEHNLLQVEDFMDQIPALHIEKFGNRSTKVVLRGLNAGGAGATVATLIDEAALTYASGAANGGFDIANLDTYDLSRVEVLRGPQGTLYGAAAVGGLVKYVTNKPLLDQFEGGVEIGSEKIEQGDSGFTGRGMLNVPLFDGVAALRVTGFYKDIPGFIDNPLSGRDNANDGERYGGRVQLLVEPTDNFSIRLMALMQDQSYDDPGDVELVGAAFTPGTRNSNEFDIANSGDFTWNSLNRGVSDNETRLYTLELNWSTSSFNILSATSFGEINSTFRVDITSDEVAAGVTFGDAFSPVYGVPISIYSDQTNDLEKFNQEFRISSIEAIEMGEVSLDWQLGVFYSEEDITFNQFFDALDAATGAILLTDIFAPFGAPQLPVGGSTLPATYEEIAIFGEVVVHFNDQMEVAIGGRYASNEQESQVSSFAGLANGPFDIFNPVVKTDEEDFTWSLAPSYHFTEDTVAYARIATGYRPGGPSLLIPGAPPDFPLGYVSDSTLNYEIGFKGDMADGLLSFDVAAFYIDWDDIQVLTQFISTTSGQTFNITGNAGKATSQGLEWNLAWQPVEGLTVSDVGAYVDAALSETARSLGAVDGDQLPYNSEWTNTLNIDYTTSVRNVAVTVGATWRYVGERFTGFAAPVGPTGERLPGSHVELPSYSTFSARVVAEFEHFYIRLFGRNLTDEHDLVQYTTGGGFNNAGKGQIIQPRTIGISVGANF